MAKGGYPWLRRGPPHTEPTNNPNITLNIKPQQLHAATAAARSHNSRTQPQQRHAATAAAHSLSSRMQTQQPHAATAAAHSLSSRTQPQQPHAATAAARSRSSHSSQVNCSPGPERNHAHAHAHARCPALAQGAPSNVSQSFSSKGTGGFCILTG